MKYRIRIITFANGRKEYQAQVKPPYHIWWQNLASDGSMHDCELPCDSRGSALHRIDEHFNGNCSVQSIAIEYINK
jgi:hypothetical protein